MHQRVWIFTEVNITGAACETVTAEASLLHFNEILTPSFSNKFIDTVTSL
jgi:hypothetical protein